MNVQGWVPTLNQSFLFRAPYRVSAWEHYFAAMPLKAVLSIGIVLLGLGALDAALVVGWPAWLALAERGLGVHSR